MPVDERNDMDRPAYPLFDRSGVLCMSCTDVRNVQTLKTGIAKLSRELETMDMMAVGFDGTMRQYMTMKATWDRIKVLLN